jgi:hypothetical protein
MGGEDALVSTKVRFVQTKTMWRNCTSWLDLIENNTALNNYLKEREDVGTRIGNIDWSALRVGGSPPKSGRVDIDDNGVAVITRSSKSIPALFEFTSVGQHDDYIAMKSEYLQYPRRIVIQQDGIVKYATVPTEAILELRQARKLDNAEDIIRGLLTTHPINWKTL